MKGSFAGPLAHNGCARSAARTTGLSSASELVRGPAHVSSEEQFKPLVQYTGAAAAIGTAPSQTSTTEAVPAHHSSSQPKHLLQPVATLCNSHLSSGIMDAVIG